eukprot:scaffold43418_cov60-Phaeocystis_antarctica.AAC.2
MHGVAAAVHGQRERWHLRLRPELLALVGELEAIEVVVEDLRVGDAAAERGRQVRPLAEGLLEEVLGRAVLLQGGQRRRNKRAALEDARSSSRGSGTQSAQRLGLFLGQERHEAVAADAAVDHDAAHDGDLLGEVEEAGRGEQLVDEELAHQAVHLVGHVGDGVGRVHDLLEALLQLELDEVDLRVEVVGDAVRHAVRRHLVPVERLLLLHRHLLHQALVRAHGGAARRRDLRLVHAPQRADLPVELDAHVRREEDEHLPAAGHVVRVRREAGAPRERHAAQPAERKVLAPSVLEQVDELVGLAVDLVGARARREQRVVVRVALLRQHRRRDPLNGTRAQRAGEVRRHRCLGPRVDRPEARALRVELFDVVALGAECERSRSSEW